ncbi:MAG TPA: hypothetical protein VK085_00550 [Pseudogracilibacillus sp.]|nr:hypothetical protein [Pseudogracilibacillus sp.]
MKKGIAISALGAAGVLGAGAYLLNDKMKKRENTRGFNQTFEDAGVPDQAEDVDLAQLENAKMVSEGSQFGVQYYNRMKANNILESQQNE